MERKGAGTGRRSLVLRTLKNGECQNEIKEKVERESRRERGKPVKVRVDDSVKNEEVEENPV